MAARPSPLPRDVVPELLAKYRRTRSREVILEALESVEFPESRRHNVREMGTSGPTYAMCLGMTECCVKGPMPSRAVRDRPNLARLLCEFVRHERPGFRFTSIQVNKDYAAALHVDKNDAGDSRIIGLGDHQGGWLWVADGSHEGLGRVVDLHETWFAFDGNLAHKVLPFTGRRYTLVFFSRVRGGDVGARPQSAHAKLLLGLGFPLPLEMPKCKTYPPAEERMRAARESFERFCAHTLQRGGPGHRRRLMLDGVGGTSHVLMSPTTTFSSLQAAILKKRKLEEPSGEGAVVKLRFQEELLPPSATLAVLRGPPHVTVEIFEGDAAKEDEDERPLSLLL